MGIVAGSAAITLGVVALMKGQSKALSIAGIALGALAALASIVMTIALAVAPATDVAAIPKPNEASDLADEVQRDAMEAVAEAERKSSEEVARRKAAADEAAMEKAKAETAAEREAAE